MTVAEPRMGQRPYTEFMTLPAAFANRKDTLSLTHNEKSDAAWRMVRFHNATL